nr:ribonuclease H-like domain-containing protein [Tanacetum cinerariifolium]
MAQAQPSITTTHSPTPTNPSSMAHSPTLATTLARQPPTQTHPMVTRAEVGIVKPSRFNFHKSHISPLNKSPSITLSRPNWHAAMYDEYNALVKNSTWMLILKQPNANVAPRALFQRFASNALRVGFSSIRCDSSLFIYRHALLMCIISSLHKEFEITDLEALNYFLGICVTRDSTCMFLSQRKYAMQLLECTHMVSCNPSRTPIDTEFKLGLDGDPVFDPTLYCSLTGGASLGSSQTYSPRQHTISRSSVEAEYRGVANAIAETAWIRNLLRELHFPLLSATFVYCDNISAIYLSGNHVQHQRTKHIEIDIHFVRDMVTEGHVRVLHVSSRYQYADIFTKGLSLPLFEEFHTSLSVRSSPAQYAREC